MSRLRFGVKVSPGTGRSAGSAGAAGERRRVWRPAAAFRPARGGEALQAKMMANGRICWTAAERAVRPAERYSADALLARLVGMDLEVDSPQPRYEGRYKQWVPLFQQGLRTFGGWVGTFLPRRAPAGVAVPHGVRLRIVRASAFVFHLCELCGSDIVTATQITSSAGELWDAIQFADGGCVSLQELGGGTCVDVLMWEWEGPLEPPGLAVEAARPVSMKVHAKERH